MSEQRSAETLDDRDWQYPPFDLIELSPRRTKYCLAIPIINEGERILRQLARLKELGIPELVDILILDGGSTDGSTDPEKLRGFGVRALLVKRGPGKQGAQLRMGWAYALRQGYAGIVTVDGNGKDGMEAVPRFVQSLEEGYDLVQGSRYVPSGEAVRTPLSRAVAIKLIHVPVIRMASGFRYTDTTNGYRAYSRRFLLDPRVKPFRDVFVTYEMLAYLSVRAPQLGFRVIEIPVSRRYPDKGPIPTKISHVEGNLLILRILWQVVTGQLNPPG
jgi:glycosyltransferase involved in cell wall biosynthesis